MSLRGQVAKPRSVPIHDMLQVAGRLLATGTLRSRRNERSSQRHIVNKEIGCHRHASQSKVPRRLRSFQKCFPSSRRDTRYDLSQRDKSRSAQVPPSGRCERREEQSSPGVICPKGTNHAGEQSPVVGGDPRDVDASRLRAAPPALLRTQRRPPLPRPTYPP
jgi:hypothetical protein